MKTYRVNCEWDTTGWWVVTIPEVAGAVTQCKRLDKVPDDVGEVLELLTGKKPGEYDLDIETVVPGKAGDLAAEARALRAKADEIASQLSTTTSTAVVNLAESGFSMRDIGALTHISHQRVDQIVKINAGRVGKSGRFIAKDDAGTRKAANNKAVGKVSKRQRVS